MPGSIGEAVTEVAAGSTGGVGAVAVDGLMAAAMVEADGSIAGVMGAEAPGSIVGRGRYRAGAVDRIEGSKRTRCRLKKARRNFTSGSEVS